MTTAVGISASVEPSGSTFATTRFGTVSTTSPRGPYVTDARGTVNHTIAHTGRGCSTRDSASESRPLIASSPGSLLDSRIFWDMVGFSCQNNGTAAGGVSSSTTSGAGRSGFPVLLARGRRCLSGSVHVFQWAVNGVSPRFNGSASVMT